MSGLLRSLLDAEVASAEGDPARLAAPSKLHPEELEAIRRAVPRRQEQYGATRILARQLFARMGLPPAPVLNRQDRSPIWPAGIRGTITHTDSWCAVALADAQQFQGIGIDAEQKKAMQEPIWSRILTPLEVEEMRRRGYQPDAYGALWFSAKESVYKCLFDSVQRFIGFCEVELRFDFDASTFSVQPSDAALETSHGSLVRRLQGRFCSSDTLWVTSATLRSDD